MRATFMLTHETADTAYGPITDIATVTPQADDLDKLVETFFEFLQSAGYVYVEAVTVSTENGGEFSYPKVDAETLEEADSFYEVE